MRRPRSRRVGDHEERRQRGFLPDFRETIKAARGPREGDRAPADAQDRRTGIAALTKRRASVGARNAVP